MRPTFAAIFAAVLAVGVAAPSNAAAAQSAQQADAAQAVGASIYAIDSTHRSVVRFAGGTAAPTVVAGGFVDPEKIVLDRYNNVYVLDAGASQLVRIAAASGAKTVLRSNVSQDPQPTMAVDGSGQVYLLDGRSILKYAAATGVATTLGTATIDGFLTVDGSGHVSVTGRQDLTEQTPVLVDTYPLAGGVPTRRSLPEDLSVGGIAKVTETAGGALYVWLYAGGGSGAEYIVRLTAGSSTTDDISTAYGDFMDTVDRSGNYYLMQTRRWCVWPAVISGSCADDFAVDAVLKFAPPRTPRVSRAVTGVSLPLGGIAVDDAGNLYAAEVPFNWEPAGLHVPPAQLVRVGATTGARSVVATGNYLDPVIASTAPGRAGTTAATVSGSRATLTWSAPTSNGGSPITGYRLSRNGTDSKGTGPWSTVIPATARSFTFGNLVPGSTYALSVQAINGLGTGAAGSATVKVPVPPAAPQSLTLVFDQHAHSATVGWQAPATDGGSPVTGYRVARDGQDSAGTGPWSTVVPAAPRSHTFNLLIPGRTYILSVRAITAAGTSIPAYVKY